MSEVPWQPTCTAPRGVVRPVPVDPTGRSGPTRSQARRSGWRRTSPGFYVPAHVDPDVPEQRIAEGAVLLPRGGAVDGWGALRLARARYFDGLMPDGVTRRPLALLVGPDQSRRRRDGVSWWRGALDPADLWVRDGIVCVRPEPALFDEMRRASDLRRAVEAADMACAAELTSLARMQRFVAGRAREGGVRQVREALGLADENSWSPSETRMRLVWQLDAGLPRPLTNREVFAGGRLLGIADLLDPVAGVAGEFDGAEHARPARRSRDAVKQEAFAEHGLELVRITAYDEHRPGAVADRLRAAYARAARRRQIPSWTLDRPPGREPPLSLDERLELSEVVQGFREDFARGTAAIGSRRSW